MTLKERAERRPIALRLYREQDFSTIRIARQLKVPVATVNYWVRNAGIMRSRSEAAVIARRNRLRALEKNMDAAVKLYEDGRWSVPQIARILKVPGKRPANRVYHWLRIRGVTRTRSEGLRMRHARERTATAPLRLNPPVPIPKVA